jgi:basic membrane lipoprotein Med (substrate-binding protein (PBP1-ABC) superfamily)
MRHRSVLSVKNGIRGMSRLAAAGIALVALAACGGSSGDAAKGDSAAAGSAPLRVALLTPGPISDQAWNSSAYAGLLALRDSMGAEISNIQTKTPAEFEENFRQYGAQGCAGVWTRL